MEDPGKEWKYEEINDSLVESRKSGLSWLWSKGLWFGEKVLVTSFVISFAPLVIPPLLVLSALGFAVSIPAGVAIASYTCMEKIMKKLLPASAPPSTMLEEENGSVEQIGLAEKDQGVMLDDMCVNSTTDIAEVEGNEVSPDARFDKDYYAEDAGEYDGAERIESHEVSNPEIEDFGDEEVKEPSKEETDSPIEVKDEDTEKEQPKEETDSRIDVQDVEASVQEEQPKEEINLPIEVQDVGTSVQEEQPKEETNSPIEVQEIGASVQEEQPKEEINSPIEVKDEDSKKDPNEETRSPIEVQDVGASVQEDSKEEQTEKETNSPIEVKDEDSKKEQPKEETSSPIEVQDVGASVQEDSKEEPPKEETDSLIEVKDEDTQKEQPKEETDLPIEVQDVEASVQEKQPKEETNSPIEVQDVGASVQKEQPKEEPPKKETDSPIEVKDEDTKKEQPKEETDSPIEVQDVEASVQEEQPKEETNSPIEVQDVGASVQEKQPKEQINSPIEVKDIGTLVQEDTKKEQTKKEVNSPIEVKDVGTQEDTKSTDTNKLAGAVVVSREAQSTAGNAAEVKIPEGTTGLLKKTRDDSISHEPSKRKNKKQIKSSYVKTVEGKNDHKTVTSTKETGNKATEVGDEKLKTVDPNGLKAENSVPTVQVPTVEMKKSVILESIVVEDRSTTKGDEKPIRYQSVSVFANQAGEDHHNVHENVILGMTNKSTIHQVHIEDVDANDNSDKQKVIPSSANVDVNVNLGMGNKRTTKEIRIAGSAADDNLDKQKAIPSSTKTKGTAGNVTVNKRRADSATGVTKDPAEKGLKTSKQDSAVHKALNEKKLWDKVDALRLIVGYKADKQPSLTEELKALYVFTGAEPPSSFQDSDDIRGAEDKLHFLMSIVGVK